MPPSTTTHLGNKLEEALSMSCRHVLLGEKILIRIKGLEAKSNFEMSVRVLKD